MNCDSGLDEVKSLNVFESTVSLWLEGSNECFGPISCILRLVY